MSLILPVVHLNGTSKQELLELREGAYQALTRAVEALRNMAPNGRDFYPVPGRMDLALAQHTRRMKVLTDLMKEIEEECLEIDRL
jgi:hypothetical protein